MLSHVSNLSKRLTANVACVRLHSDMHPHVVEQVPRSHELLSAVWVSADVDNHYLSVLRVLSKNLWVLVVFQLVEILQVCFGGEVLDDVSIHESIHKIAQKLNYKTLFVNFFLPCSQWWPYQYFGRREWRLALVNRNYIWSLARFLCTTVYLYQLSKLNY